MFDLMGDYAQIHRSGRLFGICCRIKNRAILVEDKKKSKERSKGKMDEQLNKNVSSLTLKDLYLIIT